MRNYVDNNGRGLTVASSVAGVAVVCARDSVELRVGAKSVIISNLDATDNIKVVFDGGTANFFTLKPGQSEEFQGPIYIVKIIASANTPSASFYMNY